MGIVIAKCSCHHEFQDSEYGKGLRVHSEFKVLNGKPTRLRCSVCARERDIFSGITTSVEKIKKKDKKKGKK